MKVMEKEGTSTGARGQDITEATTLPDILSVNAAEVAPQLGGDVQADHRVLDNADQHWTRASSW